MISPLVTISVLSVLLVSVLANGKNEIVIKNKYTGMVLNGAQEHANLAFFDKEDKYILWKKEPTTVASDVFSFTNVGNGKVLEANVLREPVLAKMHDNSNKLWKVTPKGKIYSVAYPKRFLTFDNELNAVLTKDAGAPGSDEWLLLNNYV